jgi:hypothetical protein
MVDCNQLHFLDLCVLTKAIVKVELKHELNTPQTRYCIIMIDQICC